jgi:hypothetical protein
VWVQGGQIGCHGYWAGVGDIAVGSRSAFLLVPNAPRPNVPDVQEAWQVWSISGDQVATEFEGKVPLARSSSGRPCTDLPVHHSRSSQSGGTSARAPDTCSAAVSASARRTADGMTAMRAARSM